MSNYASEAHPGSRSLLVLSLMGLAALLFYLLQVHLHPHLKQLLKFLNLLNKLFLYLNY